MRGDGSGHIGERVAEVLSDEPYAQHHRHDEAETFEGVGPHHRFHTSEHGIEPNEGNRDYHVERERDAERPEHKHLEHGAHHKEAHCGAEHLGDEEEPRAGAMGRRAKPLLEVAVDRHKVAFIEQRDEHICNGEIAHDEAEHHLQIGIAFGGHHAGHGDECYAGDAGAEHAEGYQRPGGATSAGEECGIVAASAGKPRHEHEHGKVAGKREYNQNWG